MFKHIKLVLIFIGAALSGGQLRAEAKIKVATRLVSQLATSAVSGTQKHPYFAAALAASASASYANYRYGKYDRAFAKARTRYLSDALGRRDYERAERAKTAAARVTFGSIRSQYFNNPVYRRHLDRDPLNLLCYGSASIAGWYGAGVCASNLGHILGKILHNPVMVANQKAHMMNFSKKMCFFGAVAAAAHGSFLVKTWLAARDRAVVDAEAPFIEQEKREAEQRERERQEKIRQEEENRRARAELEAQRRAKEKESKDQAEARWGNKIRQEKQRRRQNDRLRQHETLSCSTCLDEKPGNAFTTLSCGHEFCTACLQEMVSNALKSKELSELRCPLSECQRKPLTQEDLLALVHEASDFVKMDKIKFRNWAKQEAGCNNDCSTPGCLFVFAVNPQAPRENMRCPDCTKEYCAKCLKTHALAIPCDDERELKRWIQEHNVKQCPQCKHGIEKNEGCNHMTCKSCKHEFCWTCLGPYRGMGRLGTICDSYKCGNPPAAQQRVEAPRNGLAALTHPEVTQGYIMSWTAGVAEDSSLAEDCLAINALPIVVRVGFSGAVDDAFIRDFFRDLSHVERRRNPKFPNEVILFLPPGTTRQLFQGLLNRQNRIRRTNAGYE